MEADLSNDHLLITVGVISDTHIPDRVDRINPDILAGLQAAGVSRIFHAGDISMPPVLAELEKIAPVDAVRGNRDLVFGNSLPMVKVVELGGVRLAIMHGHGGWKNYLIDKLVYYQHGYILDRYLPVLLNTVPDADVVIFGHTHFPENLRFAGRLVFNPGSASSSISRKLFPTYGLLRIYAGGKVEAEIIPVKTFQIRNRKWETLE
jgi:putative phosphoesterase